MPTMEDYINEGFGYSSIKDLKEALADQFNALAEGAVLVVVSIHDVPDRFDFFVPANGQEFLNLPTPTRNQRVEQFMASKTSCDADYVGCITPINGDFEPQFDALRLR